MRRSVFCASPTESYIVYDFVRRWNFVDDTESYPKQGWHRTSEPVGFAGFNVRREQLSLRLGKSLTHGAGAQYSMAAERCTPPIEDYTFDLPTDAPRRGDVISSLGPFASPGTNIPPWIQSPARKWEGMKMGEVSQAP